LIGLARLIGMVARVSFVRYGAFSAPML